GDPAFAAELSRAFEAEASQAFDGVRVAPQSIRLDAALRDQVALPDGGWALLPAEPAKRKAMLAALGSVKPDPRFQTVVVHGLGNGLVEYAGRRLTEQELDA